MSAQLEPQYLFAEGPICESCSRPILDARSGLLVWNRCIRSDVVFEGLHFVHKGPCDPGNDYISFFTLDRIIASPEEFTTVLAVLSGELAALPSFRAEHWSGIYTVFAWLSRWSCEVTDVLARLGHPIPLATADQIRVEADRVVLATRSFAAAA